MWEKFPIQDPVFCGLGERPAEFPEIELTYDTNTARAEAARCYRCDAETGSADYSVQHREDIFSIARTDPRDAPKLEAMLDRGGEITRTGVRFAPDRNEDERTGAVVNILEANAGEASMMARCAGKTRLHNIEPEDLRSITQATAATGIPLAGTRAA